jgi:hypothetical protein
MRWASIGWVVGLALVLPASAWGQSDAARGAARDLGAQGVEDYQAGRYQPASEKLNRAFEILRVPTLGLWSARALAKTNKLVEASERYLTVTRLDASKGDTAVQKQAMLDAANEREALLPRISGLTVEVLGADHDASVTLDGAPLESALLGIRQPANPGHHVAEAQQGDRSVKAEVTLVEGKDAKLVLDFAKAMLSAATGGGAISPSEPTGTTPSDQTDQAGGAVKVPVGVWVGLAVAGAGLATGGITAGMAAGKKSDLACPNNVCQPSQRDDVDSYNGLRTISTIGFVAAGVGAAAAATFWFTRPRKPEAAYVAPWVGVASAGVRGAF